MEQEIKLAILTEDTLALSECGWLMQLLDGEIEHVHLSNTYFDTEDKALMTFGAGLRLREINGRWLQTVKCNGEVVNGLHQRPEWEQPLTGPEFDLLALKQTALAPLLADDAVWSRIQPVFTTDFDRQICMLASEGSLIELAYDRGIVKAGDQQDRIHEIELELKQGDITQCRRIAERLMTELPLQYSDISKAAQGYRLSQLIENK